MPKQGAEARLRAFLLVSRLLSNDVTKLILFLVSIFLLAAFLVPAVYNVGQFLAEITATKSVNPFIDYLGRHARKADYARYFNRSLYLAALILLPFLLVSIGNRATPRLRPHPWSFALPRRSIATKSGQPLKATPHFIRQLAGGFLLGSLILGLTGFFAVSLGVFTWGDPGRLPEVIPGAFTAAVIVALVEEMVFRGVILGLLLRAFRPGLAIAMAALIFAGLHYLRPPENTPVANPESLSAGFTFLRIIVARLFDSELMVQQFATLFTAGIILGATRFLTSSLWLPIGLHAGWVFTLRTFDSLASVDRDLPRGMGYLIGDHITEGFLPLGALGLTALVLWVIYREPDQPKARPSHLPLDSVTPQI